MSILKDNSQIGPYQVVGRIDDGRYNYREVYEVIRLDNKESPYQYALTVYDTDLWKQAKGSDSTINEISVCKGTETGLPQFLDEGTLITTAGKEIIWMCQKKVDAIPLIDYYKSVDSQNETCLVDIIRDLITITRNISRFFGNGGHYSLQPGNIFVHDNFHLPPQIVLTGLTHAGIAYRGNPPFSYSELNTNYLAPEAKIGIYDVQTDIYAIGCVIKTLLTLNDEIFQDDFHKRVKHIVSKATARKRSERIKTLNEFYTIMGYLLKEQAPSSKQDSTLREKNPQNKVDKIKKEEGNISDITHLERCNVCIKQQKGDGFAAVAGFESLKDHFNRNIIMVLRHKEMAKALGVTPTNSILLYGPPGCGKSYFAKRLSEEAGINYALITPSSLASTLIHGSQQMISDLFRKLEKQAPVLVAIDEAEAIAPNRLEDNTHHQAGEVNELLTQINNCADRGIYVLMMTNYPERMEPALLRKGRTDEIVYVPLPDQHTRKKIFELELRDRLHEEDIDCDKLSQMTMNFTSSDISYIVKEASRRDLYECVNANMESPMPISQSMLEEVIRQTTSSVTPDQIRHYELLRERMEGIRHQRPQVGFYTNK